MNFPIQKFPNEIGFMKYEKISYLQYRLKAENSKIIPSEDAFIRKADEQDNWREMKELKESKRTFQDTYET